MNNQDYEQKKQQCWEEYIAKHGIKNAIPEDAFSFTFDRAFALGKQEKAKNATKPKFKIGQHVMYKGSKAKILNYHEHCKYPYYILLSDRDAYVKGSEIEPCTERRKIAAMAMQGILANYRITSSTNVPKDFIPTSVAIASVHYADALIAELNKKKQ